MGFLPVGSITPGGNLDQLDKMIFPSNAGFLVFKSSPAEFFMVSPSLNGDRKPAGFVVHLWTIKSFINLSIGCNASLSVFLSKSIWMSYWSRLANWLNFGAQT